MKRDMDIVRRIALATADLPYSETLDRLEDVDDTVFATHVQWMEEAGLVKASVAEYLGGNINAVVLRLTWDGCEFADSVRSDTLWRAAKEKVLMPSASWTFGLLKEWLATEIREGFPALGR